jgi:hypothetical protein
VDSNSHDRTVLAVGSHPIHDVPPPIETFRMVVVKCATTKFWLSVHTNDTRAASPFSTSSTHPPINPSSPLRCS